MFEVTAPSHSFGDTDLATMQNGPGESKLTSKSQSSIGASWELSAALATQIFAQANGAIASR